MAFIDVIKAKAKADLKTVVLPEGMDRRTWEAAAEATKQGLAKVIVLATPEEQQANAEGLDLTGITVLDPHTAPKKDAYVNLLYELRKAKGMTPEDAAKLVVTDYTYFGTLMIKSGDADGLVSGACHSTANTLRPALQIIKTKPGVKLVSSFFLMEVPNCEFGYNGTFVFADCGLEPNPDPEKLAAIAGSSAESFEKMVGAKPIVAMLSHSSYGSAKNADVEKVQAGVKIAKELYPQYEIDGELQLDAAIVPSVGAKKAPASPVAGKANVLIFPDLDAGNIGYKLVQRLAKAEAYGPVCQGIAAPVNDLSRGCSSDDIVGVIAITAVQAQG
ncbi:MAG: phosphate acetyltransferase [Lachnospiraceae bacterium]|nr:phosphate acetyltransferase [Lachnospiraceae bacterium]MBR5738893.1 phosphate acetyltransferase [Lachnospiraceae bacterium]